MKKPAIVTIGVFDGVHLGHQVIIRQVVDRAHALGLRSMAVTFHPHPEQVLFPERKLTYLTGPGSPNADRTASRFALPVRRSGSRYAVSAHSFQALMATTISPADDVPARLLRR